MDQGTSWIEKFKDRIIRAFDSAGSVDSWKAQIYGFIIATSTKIRISAKSLTNATPLDVNIVDGDGTQITTFGGGTQFADGAARGTATGTIAMVDDGTNIQSMKGDSSGRPAMNVEQVGGSAIALGQALAASSIPVILPSATITTLTPPAAITGFNLETTQELIKAKTDNIPALGQALAASSVPVILPSATITTLTPPAAITGFATSALQSTQDTSINTLLKPANTLAAVTTVSTVTNLAQQGGVAISLNTGVRDTGTQRVTIATNDSVPVTGTFFQATQPVSLATLPVTNAGTFAVQATLTAETTKVIGTVNVADSQTIAVTNAGTFAVQLATNTPLGNVAHDAVDSGAPIKIGGKAVNAEVTAVANLDRADLITDLVGKLIVLPYANPENFVSGAITTAMTGTTSTSLVAAPDAGLRNYITTIIVSNAHATVGTDIIIQDGSGGTTLLTIPAGSVYGGAVITLPTPLRQPTTATALFCANVTTGASTKASAVGYIGQ